MTNFFQILEQKIDFSPSEKGVAEKWFRQVERDSLFANSISSGGGGGGVSSLSAGNVTIDWAEGVTLRNPDTSARTIYLDPDGDAWFGSNIDEPSDTALSIFANDNLYNGESLGAGDLLLGDNSSSKANLLWDRSAGQLKFRSGTTEGIVLDTDGTLTVGASAPNIIIDGQNSLIKSSNYSADAAGWQIDKNGDAEFNSIKARGKIQCAVFEYQSISAIGGSMFLSKNAGEVAVDVTTAASFTLSIFDADNGTIVFENGDRLRIKYWNGTEIVDIWLVVASAPGSAGGISSAIVTLQSGGTGKAIQKGAAVVNYGPSGSGIMHLQAGEETTRMRIATHTGSPWTAVVNQLVIGNLRGTYGAGANDYYGLGVGDYAGGNYLVYNADGAGSFVLSAGDGVVTISEQGIRLNDTSGTTSQVYWYYDDSGTPRLLGRLAGDYAGAGNGTMWLQATRDASSPWDETSVIIGVADDENSLDARMTLWTDAAFTSHAALYITKTHVSIEVGLKVGGYSVGVAAGSIEATGDIYTTEWTDYSATSTIVGWTSYTEKVIEYKKVGNLVYVSFRIAGTSNSTSTTFTLPDSEGQTGNPIAIALTRDDGTWDHGYFSLGGSTVTFFKSPSAAASDWTASGLKSIHGQFVYEAA